MNIVMSFNCIKLKVFSVLATVMFSTSIMAVMPFTGKIPATIVSSEAANIIHVNIETRPGFQRDFSVNFLSNATTVHVRDMQMQMTGSASLDAISSIYTNNGTLDNALRREKLAKLVASTHDESWCE